MDRQRIFVTGGSGGCGTSTLAVGLARAFALRGDRVALLDADLSRPSLDLLLGQAGAVYHLGDLLSGARTPREVALPVGERLLLVPGRLGGDGGACPSPVSFLDRIQAELEADVLLVDTDPQGAALLGHACDTGILCHSCLGGALSRTAAVRASLDAMGVKRLRLVLSSYGAGLDLREMIDTVGAQLLGAVPREEHKQEVAYANIAARLSGEVRPLLSGMARAEDGADPTI